MGLPFTVDQFLAVFADYNRSYWAVAVGLWIASAALIAAWRRPTPWSGALSALLAAQWLWSGVAYHALLFTRINPAAGVFAAMFVAQAALFAWRRRVAPITRRGQARGIERRRTSSPTPWSPSCSLVEQPQDLDMHAGRAGRRLVHAAQSQQGMSGGRAGRLERQRGEFRRHRPHDSSDPGSKPTTLVTTAEETNTVNRMRAAGISLVGIPVEPPTR